MYSLIGWNGERAGAGLAVDRGTAGRVSIVTRRAAFTAVSRRVVVAVLQHRDIATVTHSNHDVFMVITQFLDSFFQASENEKKPGDPHESPSMRNTEGKCHCFGQIIEIFPV